MKDWQSNDRTGPDSVADHHPDPGRSTNVQQGGFALPAPETQSEPGRTTQVAQANTNSSGHAEPRTTLHDEATPGNGEHGYGSGGSLWGSLRAFGGTGAEHGATSSVRPAPASQHIGSATDNQVSATSTPAPRQGGAPRAGADQDSAAAATKPDLAVPGAHGKTSVTFWKRESGTVTGSISLSMQTGPTGIGGKVGDDVRLASLKSAMGVELNGWVAKAETTLISGELDRDILDGIKIKVGANAFKGGISSDKEGVSLDLVNMTVGLEGNVNHWVKRLGFQLAEGMNWKLTGQLSIALGGKLAAKLASYTARLLEQEAIAKQIDEATDELEKHRRKYAELSKRKPRGVLQKSAHWASLNDTKKKLKKQKKVLAALRDKLDDAAQQAQLAWNAIDSRIAKTKLGKAIARAMASATVKSVERVMVKLIPVLNLVSTIVDMMELARLFKLLWDREYRKGGGGDSDSDGDRDSGSGDATDPAAAGDDIESSATAPPAETTVKAQDASAKAARGALHPVARSIVDKMITAHPGLDASADQFAMIGHLVPKDLSFTELVEIERRLKGQLTSSSTGEDLLVAISDAVRAVRSQKAKTTISIDGVNRPDLARSDAHAATTSGGTAPAPSPTSSAGDRTGSEGDAAGAESGRAAASEPAASGSQGSQPASATDVWLANDRKNAGPGARETAGEDSPSVSGTGSAAAPPTTATSSPSASNESGPSHVAASGSSDLGPDPAGPGGSVWAGDDEAEASARETEASARETESTTESTESAASPADTELHAGSAKEGASGSKPDGADSGPKLQIGIDEAKRLAKYDAGAQKMVLDAAYINKLKQGAKKQGRALDVTLTQAPAAADEKMIELHVHFRVTAKGANADKTTVLVDESHQFFYRPDTKQFAKRDPEGSLNEMIKSVVRLSPDKKSARVVNGGLFSENGVAFQVDILRVETVSDDQVNVLVAVAFSSVPADWKVKDKDGVWVTPGRAPIELWAFFGRPARS